MLNDGARSIALRRENEQARLTDPDLADVPGIRRAIGRAARHPRQLASVLVTKPRRHARGVDEATRQHVEDQLHRDGHTSR